MNKGLVHIDNPEGHRKAYANLFTQIFGFSELVSPVAWKSIRPLIQADKLLFATVGRHFKRHLLVTIFRAILNKPSATLFLGASDYCKGKKKRFDFLLLKLWKVLPKQQLFAIISYKVLPELSEITNGYIYDPQLWDIWIERSNTKLPKTKLSIELSEISKGRKTLLFIGKTKSSKSYNEFVDFSIANSKEVCAVSAGKVAIECAGKANQLKSNKMIVIDRYISDEELLSLYGIADFVWCYYGVKYDQSSGVYGRAIQLGIPTIIRKNSTVHKIARDFKIPSHAIDIETNSNYRNIYEKMKASKSNVLSETERKDLFENLYKESVLKLKDALKLD